jgi:hypothetical protein
MKLISIELCATVGPAVAQADPFVGGLMTGYALAVTANRVGDSS